MRTDPVHRYLDDLEGLNDGHLPSWHSHRVCELANGLRLDTVLPKVGSEWILGHHVRVRASKGKYLSIGPGRSIPIRWLHVTFSGNPYRENLDR
jgi:hypothetical protein